MSAETGSRPLVGLTGARFGNARRRGLDRPPPPPDTRPSPTAPEDPIGQTGARFGGARRRRRVTADRAPAPATPVTRIRIGTPPADDPTPPEVPSSSASPVRPYVLTRGRTRSAVVLSLETLVSAAPAPPPGARLPRTHEHHAAVRLCREPRSVAEIAARLGVPLGVACVLLGDLASAGFVLVHPSAPTRAPDLALLERVLQGLRRL
jgi:hypothetical protein